MLLRQILCLLENTATFSDFESAFKEYAKKLRGDDFFSNFELDDVTGEFDEVGQPTSMENIYFSELGMSELTERVLGINVPPSEFAENKDKLEELLFDIPTYSTTIEVGEENSKFYDVEFKLSEVLYDMETDIVEVVGKVIKFAERN